MISTLEQELREKSKQLGEKLVEVETLKGMVSQQQDDMEHLKSKSTRLEGSLCLAESEAHRLLTILRPLGKSSSVDTNAFLLRSCSPQASESSSPQQPRIRVPVRTWAERLEMLHRRAGAPSGNSRSGTASPRPGKLNFTEVARPSRAVGTSEAIATAAASIQNFHDSPVPRLKSGLSGMLRAGTPPPMAVPSMASRWQTNDVLSAWETKSALQIPKTRGTLARQMKGEQKRPDWPNWPRET